ncbi:MAG: hypothetical protein JST47_06060 [Bacteroidetes bacterium]|nr:hypothetical protein [Bacteroidota bacterium]
MKKINDQANGHNANAYDDDIFTGSGVHVVNNQWLMVNNELIKFILNDSLLPVRQNFLY